MGKLAVKVHAWLRRRSGQGMVEYGLILALVAVALITIISQVGDDIETIFIRIRDAI